MIYFILTLIFIAVIGIWKKQSFWISVFLISDPGGIVGGFLSKSSFGGVFYSDIFFVLIWGIFFFRGFSVRTFFSNDLAKSIYYTLFVMMVYKIFVWGLLVPGVDLEYFFRFTLVRERDTIFTFLLIIPIFVSAVNDMDQMLSYFIIPATIVLLISIFSMAFGLDLIKYTSLERYRASGIDRLLLDNEGLLNFVIPVSIFVYLTKIRIKFNSILLVGGALSIISLVVSITKNVYLNLLGMILSVLWLSSKLFKMNLSGKIIKSFLGLIFIGILINILFPNYLIYAFKGFMDLFLLISEGQTADGDTSRMWQIPAFLYEIKRNLLFGTGAGYDQLSKQFDINQFDATDLPLLAHIMQYGILGIGLYIIYYLKIFSTIKIILKNLAKISIEQLAIKYKNELIFAIASIAFFSGYFIKIYTIFIELTHGPARIEMTIYTAILLACVERIRVKMNQDRTNIKTYYKTEIK